MSDLPPGWIETDLGVISDVIRGITFPAASKEGAKTSTNVGCLRTTNIQREIDWSDVYYVPRSFVKRADQFVRVGDILMSMANSYDLVGKVAVARSVPYETAFGAFLSAVRPTAATNGQYLFHLLRTPYVQRELRAGSSQTTNIANISTARLSAIKVPLAPSSEQRRIADKLDAVLRRIDACRDRLDRVPQVLKKFREAVLEAAVSGRLTEEWRTTAAAGTSGINLVRAMMAAHISRGGRRKTNIAATPVDEIREVPASWGWASGETVVEAGADIVYGIVQPGPKLADGIPYVRGMDIENGKILVHQLMKTSEAIAKRYERASLRGGDVLLGIIRATKVAIVPNDLGGANITQGTARFRPSSGIRTGYLARVLEAPATQKWLHDRYRGIDMPGLNLADVRRVPIPMPPLEEQDEIVRRVDELFALSDSLQRRYDDAVAWIETLTPSVLAKAFRGQLVPQDPNDEPAERIFERIKDGRAALHRPASRPRTGAIVVSRREGHRGP